MVSEVSKFIDFTGFKESHGEILENNIPPLTQKDDELWNRGVANAAIESWNVK